jgi:hypothetical protein
MPSERLQSAQKHAIGATVTIDAPSLPGPAPAEGRVHQFGLSSRWILINITAKRRSVSSLR